MPIEIFTVLIKTLKYNYFEKNFSTCFVVKSGSKKLDWNNSNTGKIIMIKVSDIAGKRSKFDFCII